MYGFVMSEVKDTVFAGHNYHADYKFKNTIGQKANGEVQIKEITVRAEEEDQCVKLAIKILEDDIAICKEKHIKHVSCYEKGFEPTAV